jgi:alkylation response protein AidB-like acyl-CoA dehydrogenase
MNKASKSNSAQEDSTTAPVRQSPAKALFLGNIIEEELFPFPQVSQEEKETLAMIIESVDKFMDDYEEQYRTFDREGAQPDDYVDSLRELGLFGLIIPEEQGGIGLSNSGYSRVLQQTSRHDASTSLTIGAHSSIGMKGLLLFGNEDQKSRYLPKLATGELVAAFCLTESGAGSDAASIKTRAVKNTDGSWTLNGEKLWITNGPFAGFFTVFARTDSEQGRISAFLVEREFRGVSAGPKEDKMGIRASATSTVHFQDVRVPAENLLGDEGHGFKIAMAILNNGRTGLGGGCVGGMKRCIEMAVRQSKERKQFDRSISEFELVQEKIAQMTVDCFASESVVAVVGHLIDSGHEDYSVEAAMSKVFVSESMWRVANEALQVAGGNGFMREYPYERIVRDCRINLIFEGTNEILRLFIALSGFKDAGAYLKEIGKGAAQVFNDPIKGFGVLSGYASRKVTHLTSLGLDRIESLSPELANERRIFEFYTMELSKSVEGLLKRLGKNIVGSQLLSKRVADTATDIFVGLCVLSRVDAIIRKAGSADRCENEIRIARLFSQQAKRRMNRNLRSLSRNEDTDLNKLAAAVLEQDGYQWDTI